MEIEIPQTNYSQEMVLEHFGSFTDLVESLKFVVQDRTGIPAERIHFMVGDELVSDNESLYDVGLFQSCSINTLIDIEE